MNREDVIRMAQEAGLRHPVMGEVSYSYFKLAKFAALVAAAEREACAGISEADAVGDDPACCTNTGYRIAAAIRARGQS
jgi:hypothetical protein